MARRNHQSGQKRRPRSARSSSSRCSPKRHLEAVSRSTKVANDEVKAGHRCSYRVKDQLAVPASIVHSTGGACTPFSLAVYRPASLMTMLLVASLLPKNTFSLRWLVLSGGGGGGSDLISEGYRVPFLGKRQSFQGQKTNRNAMQSPSWLATAVDSETTCMEECDSEKDATSASRFDRKVAISLWNEVASSLEEQTSRAATSSMQVGHDQEDWSRSILDSIPRGGDIDDQKTYAGLINLGNTCYLNSQLQCAYHVPYLRQMVLNAQDEVVEVEVEVEVDVEVEEEKKDDGVVGDEEMVEKIDDVDEIDNNSDESTDNQAASAEEGMDNDTDEQSRVKTQTVRRTEVKKEVHPISIALRSLQHTFSTLDRATTSGTTNILCRALGINPYVQQDGQEFWKLFIPQVDYDKLSQLYSGFFEDYVREILPEDVTADAQPRERIRTEPFLDLSIPVAEGNVGSIETSLREMFTEPETLHVSEGNGWRPEKGAEKVDALKGSSLKLEGLPSLLQLHLKRFKYDWETGETSKINDCVKFPLELSLSEIISDDGEEEDEDTIYDLQSIVIHRGEYGSGHYYSYVRPDIRSDDWYRFDDSQVTPVDYREVVADAYGGRYRRKRSRSVDGHNAMKKRRGLLSRIFSIFSFGRSGSVSGGGFGYGGRTSSAYMLQYVRRSEIPTLYLEDNN